MSKTIKQLFEETYGFSPIEYQDNDQIANHEINDALYKYFPKTKNELRKIIKNKFERLEQSLLKNDNQVYTLDLSDINIKNITDISYIFQDVYNESSEFLNPLKLDLSSWDTSNITNMMAMFWGLKTLVSIDLSNFNTSNVTDMRCMFHGCESLQEVNLSSFNT